ncbi:hypothetical protein WA026_011806 [Henosepilachna vigintioctopunctata]|uniref:Uncharacterized protein n=1 Tax=Henosepilachna vigintioctopunctata TaxID=420089 RepID=A0AAW1UJ50_9CUCU
MKLAGKEDKRESWKSYNIMKAIHNKEESWKEVKKKLYERGKQRQVLEDIAAMIEGSELEDVAVEDHVELVTTHDDLLSNEDLNELQNNPIHDEEEKVEEKVLSSGGIQNALLKIY